MLINDVRRVTVSFGAAIAAMALWSGFAFADAMAESGPARESNGLRMRTFKVADVVVQQPPAAQPTVVAPAPVVADTGPRKVVQADTHSRNYVGTIMWSALGGAVLGAAVGTAIYFLSEDDDPPVRNIGYWAAGGVLVGAGVGVVQVMVEEGRTSNAMSMRAPKDPAPTLRLALYRHPF